MILYSSFHPLFFSAYFSLDLHIEKAWFYPNAGANFTYRALSQTVGCHGDFLRFKLIISYQFIPISYKITKGKDMFLTYLPGILRETAIKGLICRLLQDMWFCR